MGWVDIPNTIGTGTTLISADLDRGEAEDVIRLLKAAVTRLTNEPKPVKPQHSAPAKQELPSPPVQPENSENRSSTIVAHEASRQSTAYSEAILLEKLRERLERAECRTQTISKASPPARCEQGLPKWKKVWQTEEADHNREPILASVYSPILDDLPGGNGHGGWLISASKGLINLWECNLGRGEPALQLMHSQATDARLADLALERGTKLLSGAAFSPSRSTEGVLLHSIDPDIGMFAPKGLLPLQSSSDAPFPKHQAALNPQARQVASLHSFQGPLSGCVAASLKNTVTIYPTIGLASNLKPKTRWEAHTAIISQLHRSSFGIDLYTAAVDGSVHRWELKAKPKLPAAKFGGLTGEVTGLQQINDTLLLAASACGLVAVWDARRPEKAMRLIASPDRSGITKLAVSPEQRLGAFATAQGKLFSLNLELESAHAYDAQQMTSQQLPHAVSALSWNSRKQLLMAASGPSVLVFSQAV